MDKYAIGLRSITLIAATSTLAACASANNPTPNATTAQSATSPAATSPATPTLTASSLQPPSQDNKYTRTSGRPKVTFDPCTWLPDDAISKIGFDPSTRKRGNDMVSETIVLTCDFENADEGLQLDSSNVTLEEVKQKYAGRTQDLTINGRDAILTPNKSSSEDCSVDIRTKSGYFGVTFLLSTKGGLKGIQPCDHIVDAATALEPYIGKDN
ncbi:DUF3558 domain-containing protein [Nocardia sp. NPDC051570]|uniref:DUF3558 domain-containing protein n=1 Tax=Nocardia sp. NPDC051570 TaxID=3364324 RepID=UPI0037A534E0